MFPRRLSVDTPEHGRQTICFHLKRFYRRGGTCAVARAAERFEAIEFRRYGRSAKKKHRSLKPMGFIGERG